MRDSLGNVLVSESWLRSLLGSVNWCYAVVWTVDISTGLLSWNKGVSHDFYTSEAFPQHFSRYRACQFSPGQGFAWKAMFEQTNLWLSELDSLQNDHMEQMQFFKDAGIKTLLYVPTSDGVLELGNMDFVPETPELIETVDGLLASSSSFSFEQDLRHEEYGILQTDAQHYEDFGRHFDELQVQQESNIHGQCGELLSSYASSSEPVSSPIAIPQAPMAFKQYAPAGVYVQGRDVAQPQQQNLSPQNLNHMLAERRRRKREKEHLDKLKSLVPFATKRDKLSILEGAIKYIRELERTVADLGGHRREHQEAARSDEAESSKTGEYSSSNSIRLTIQPDALICTLSCLEPLGFVVDSLQLNAASRFKVDITAHPTVEGSPSCTEVQEILKAELLKQSASTSTSTALAP